MATLQPRERAYGAALTGWLAGLLLPPAAAVAVSLVAFADVDQGEFWGAHVVVGATVVLSIVLIAPLSCASALSSRGAPLAGRTAILSVPLAVVGVVVWPLLFLAPAVVRRLL